MGTELRRRAGLLFIQRRMLRGRKTSLFTEAQLSSVCSYRAVGGPLSAGGGSGFMRPEHLFMSERKSIWV